MEIKILGMGCPKCKRVEELARQAAAELGVGATFTKVDDLETILGYGIMSTPGLVINEKLVSSGRIPRREEIAEWIGAAQAS
jgi:small redox-active disulfide protein 2